ncbi:MAG: DHA2 family efflux MFS transporter permease subunit [Streptosporangiaceae bacterium]
MQDTIPRKRLLLIFLGLILGILMAALDQTIVSTAMPTIAGQLHGLNQISWLITAYLLAQTISMPLYGKFGDIVGRKRLFHFAILLFLAGSVLSGIAQTMNMLIVFRAIQGLGAGGLMVGAQSIMAEIVSARRRGRYMSIMGPMIGLATVFGPLLGGYLTQHITWRYIFYINLPIGAAALVVTALTLKLPEVRRRPKIDFAGAGLLAGAVASLVLLIDWGGTKYAWTDPITIGLIVGIVVCGVAWWFAERRAAEPVLPLHLFRNRTFAVNAVLAVMVGLGMFGAVAYLPTYLQLVLGVSATRSGLLLLPMMGGLMVAAITTGQLMSRTGHYKFFPLIGTPLAAAGMYLLSTMGVDTTRAQSSVFMIVLGLGIGFIMPVLVLTVQNAVHRDDLGTATAGINFFRQIGGSAGTAVIGTLFTSRLAGQLQQHLPPQLASRAAQHAQGITPEKLQQLPPRLAHGIVAAFAGALPPVYIYLVPVLAAAFIVAWFLKEVPLATSMGGAPAPSRGRPAGPDSAAEPESPAGGPASRPLPEVLDEVLVTLRALGARDDHPSVAGWRRRDGGPNGSTATVRQPMTPNGSGQDGPATVARPPVADGPVIAGRVYGHGQRPVEAVLALTDLEGRQLDRTRTGADGAYRLCSGTDGTYLLVCTPSNGDGYGPRAELVTAVRGSITRDISVGGE